MNSSIDAVELTKSLIGFKTINPPGNERACAEFLGNLLEDAGFAISYHEFAECRTNLVARIGSQTSKNPICFSGHIDTVPLGSTPWTVDPFSGETHEGKLFGRGSSDMKSGVAAFVAATIEISQDLEKGNGVILVITAGEETGCEGSYHLASLEGALGEAGSMVIAEPSYNQPWIGHKGALWLTARTTGVTAHGSMPEHGENAVYKAAHAISKLEDFDFNIARDEILGKPTLNVGTVQGGLNINSVPDLTEVGIDIRTTPNQDHDTIRSNLSSYLGEDVNLESIVDVGGVLTDPNNEWMQEVFDIMANILGKPPETRAASYFTDASALTPAYGGIPTVILGPGEAAMAHQTDEYCMVDRIPEAVEAYIEIAKRWNVR
ncbi:MAG: acetylornithine deacetylase [Magnetovibrio sp.]|nr:acetylornithine deacetylase [Magnetovibrio sp.]